MSELKPGWTRVKFGDVVRLVSERCADPIAAGIDRYIGLEHLEPRDLRIRSWGDVADGVTFTSRVRPGQVLFGKRRAYQRKVAVADFDAVCSGDIYLFESANPQRLLPDLLPFICQTDAFFEHAVGTSAGSLSPRTNWRSLASYEFALPPIAEQRPLVQVLTAALAQVDSAGCVEAEALVLRTSLRERLIAASSSTSTRLGDVSRMQNGKAFPGERYQASGVRLLRPANLRAEGTLDWSTDRTVCLPDDIAADAARFVVSEGDLVINLTAQSLDDAFMGRVCFARLGDDCLLNQRIGRISSTREEVLTEYLFRVLQGSQFQAHAIAMCEGTKVKHLFWHHLERFEVALPSIESQRQVCEQLDEIDLTCARANLRATAAKDLYARLRESTLAGRR